MRPLPGIEGHEPHGKVPPPTRIPYHKADTASSLLLLAIGVPRGMAFHIGHKYARHLANTVGERRA